MDASDVEVPVRRIVDVARKRIHLLAVVVDAERLESVVGDGEVVPLAVARRGGGRKKAVVAPDREHEALGLIVVEAQRGGFSVLVISVLVQAPVEYLAIVVALGVRLEPERHRIGVVRGLGLELGEACVRIRPLEVLAAGNGQHLPAHGIRDDLRQAVRRQHPLSRTNRVFQRIAGVFEQPADGGAPRDDLRVRPVDRQRSAQRQPFEVHPPLVLERQLATIRKYRHRQEVCARGVASVANVQHRAVHVYAPDALPTARKRADEDAAERHPGLVVFKHAPGGFRRRRVKCDSNQRLCARRRDPVQSALDADVAQGRVGGLQVEDQFPFPALVDVLAALVGRHVRLQRQTRVAAQVEGHAVGRRRRQRTSFRRDERHVRRFCGTAGAMDRDGCSEHHVDVLRHHQAEGFVRESGLREVVCVGRVGRRRGDGVAARIRPVAGGGPQMVARRPGPMVVSSHYSSAQQYGDPGRGYFRARTRKPLWRCRRCDFPLIKPDMRVSRIKLSLKNCIRHGIASLSIWFVLGSITF